MPASCLNLHRSLDTPYSSRKAEGELLPHKQEDGKMISEKCPVLVNGKECGLRLILIDQDVETEIGTYECPLGHRTNVLLGAVEKRKCTALLDGGKECGLALIIVDRDLESATAAYECALGHRSYAPLEPEVSGDT